MSELLDKEDILNKRSLIFYMGSGEDEVDGKKQDFLEAMDEYAQQEAIGFAQWLVRNNHIRIDDQWYQSLSTNVTELYNLYLIQSRKIK